MPPRLPPDALSSPATARNTGPILEVLAEILSPAARVLEVASGAGEHAVAALGALPTLHWTPSDPSAEARASISAWTGALALEHSIDPPLNLDCQIPATWPTGQYDALAAINMVHISPWEATLGLAKLARQVLDQTGGQLVLYGPYVEPGVPLAPSNAAFDASLRVRNPAWGLRSTHDVMLALGEQGFVLERRVSMPANNLMLIFQTTA